MYDTQFKIFDYFCTDYSQNGIPQRNTLDWLKITKKFSPRKPCRNTLTVTGTCPKPPLISQIAYNDKVKC